jgi:FkbM family methyltransferase
MLLASGKNALAIASMMVARAFAPAPAWREWYLRKAKDYVDWRCNDTILCRTNFGAALNCRLTDTIQRKLAYFGVWEPNLSAYFERVLSPGDVLADVGANIGYYSLLGSRLVGTSGRVIAVEASPEIFALLLENLTLNKGVNIRAVNCAASYEAGEMIVFAAPEENIGHTSTIPLEGNVAVGAVAARPLHQILTGDEMARCRLIKIDIEGAEPPVVRSILENIGLFAKECEIAVEVSIQNADLLDAFGRAGFHAYYLENEYPDATYIRQRLMAPRRFRGKIEKQSDFIFSRRAKDTL